MSFQETLLSYRCCPVVATVATVVLSCTRDKEALVVVVVVVVVVVITVWEGNASLATVVESQT
jgi:hypothetical protein